MARNDIGRPVGWMIALGAILLWVPQLFGQSVTIRKQTFVISGTVGLAEVSLNGFPVSPPPKTDQNGVYSVAVEYGWHGTVTPVKPGYTFSPASRSYPNVTDNKAEENYTATLKTYTISGTVMLPEVQMIGFPEEVVSDPAGKYTATVPWNWSGTVTPTKTAYQFEPASRQYNEVTRDMRDDYKGSEQMIVISGTAGVEGVVMKGLPGNPVSGPQGAYRAEVKYGWSGKVTPVKEGHEFLPAEMEYLELTTNQANQDYTARVFTYQISGTAGLAGVIIKGLPGADVMTDDNGFYAATVNHGWSGKVTPEKPGYTFTPASLDFRNVTANKENQDFSGKINYYTLSGSTGTPNVQMAGLPGDPVSNDQGLYTAQVEYGWSGSVTPTKEGFIFNPQIKEYPPVTQNVVQNFTAQGITFKISGNVGGMAQVVLKGAPGAAPLVTAADGSYSLDVPYGWKGQLAPQKAGYTFDPNVREYPEVLYPQANQDFVARIMQCSLAGRIVDETGTGVADVAIRADGLTEAVRTDANGQFDFKVNYGWKGKLTFEREGYTFNPPFKSFALVTTDSRNMAVTAKIKMMTITDRITAGTEPIAEVKITAVPSDSAPVMTDASGKYSVKVPYGWSGELKFEKPGFIFEPDSKAFPSVTADIDNVNPKPVAPVQPAPVQPAPSTPMPGQPSVGQPAPIQPLPGQPSVGQPAPIQPLPGQPAPGPTSDQSIAELQQRRNALEAQIIELKKTGGPVPADLEQELLAVKQQLNALLVGPSQAAGGPGLQAMPQGGTVPSPGPGPVVPADLELPNLHDVLAELSRRTGVSITWDATVKPDPVPIPLSSLEGLPVTLAMQKVLLSLKTPYAYEEVGTNGYLVYRPITNMFPDVDLVEALRDLAAATGVTIIPDPNVTGRVDVSFTDTSLDQALEMLLAGKPYVFKKVPEKNPRYYLVADRGGTSPSFPEISETRRIRLNYTPAARAKALLSPVFAQYVQSELPNPLDPNDQGNTLLITAAPSIVERIVEDIGKIDRYKRQVLLDARVVVMERGDLLNLGVEWGWPKIQAGLFTDSEGLTGVVNGGSWPYGVQIGYTIDRTFTDSLMMALNLLQENSQADIIANPKVVAMDGRQAEMRVVQEEWFMMTGNQTNTFYYSAAQLQKIESGTVLTITPHIGDNNDITLQMAVEVSDSIPKARGSDLPLVTRRTAKNAVTIKDGGTVAVGGLTENRSKSSEKRVPGLSDLPLIGGLFQNKNNDKATREVAVFVTAHLVPQSAQVVNNRPYEPTALPATTDMGDAGTDDDFANRLREAIARQR